MTRTRIDAFGRLVGVDEQLVVIYEAIPYMGDEKLAPLMKSFDHIVRQHEIFRAVFGLI